MPFVYYICCSFLVFLFVSSFEFPIHKLVPIDYINHHVDRASGVRILTVFLYLNDVEEGGETVFDNLEIKPKQGTLVVFPPLWMFPHRGNPPISGTKYLLSTYLHYK